MFPLALIFYLFERSDLVYYWFPFILFKFWIIIIKLNLEYFCDLICYLVSIINLITLQVRKSFISNIILLRIDICKFFVLWNNRVLVNLLINNRSVIRVHVRLVRLVIYGYEVNVWDHTLLIGDVTHLYYWVVNRFLWSHKTSLSTSLRGRVNPISTLLYFLILVLI